MTVGWVHFDGNDFYAAADSFVGGLPTKTLTDRKIEFVENQPLAWILSGDSAIGHAWSRSFKELLATAPPKSWDALVREMVPRLAEWNGVRRRAAELGRTEVDDSELGEATIAGFVGQQPEILQLHASGDWDLHIGSGHPNVAEGSGNVFAATVFHVLLEKSLLPRSGEDLVREVMGLAVKYAPECAAPVHVVRINRNRVERLADSEQRA